LADFGIAEGFSGEGLGGIVSSWIGTGENLPISGDQLNSVLHCDALNQVASKFGIDPNMLQSVMTQLLPNIVDKMTPNGKQRRLSKRVVDRIVGDLSRARVAGDAFDPFAFCADQALSAASERLLSRR